MKCQYLRAELQSRSMLPMSSAADDLHAIVLGSIVLGQDAGVGVGVVAADDDDSLDVELADDLQALLKLLDFLQLGAARANHVEAAGIAVFIDDLLRQLHVVVIHQTARAEDEAIETVLGVQLLHGVEQTGDDIVATRSLTAAEDDSHVHLLVGNSLAGNELHERHAVGIREELLDFFLVVNTLSGLAFNGLHGTLQSQRKLGLIGGASNLQCTFFHLDD